MFTVRIMKIDYYMSTPIKDLDFSYSKFRGSEVKQVPVLRIYGSTSSGYKTCLHVHGIFPYLYIPHNEENDVSISQLSYRLANSLDKAINISLGQTNSNVQHVFNVIPVIGKPIYGYHESKHTFLKIQFYNPIMIKKCAVLLQNGAVLNTVYQPHEAHINYELQFMIDYNLYGMKDIILYQVKYRDNGNKMWLNDIPKQYILPTCVSPMSTCKVEVDCIAGDIINVREIYGQNLSANPGILALWNEERERRHKQNKNYHLTPLPSQIRKINQTESEIFFFKRLQEKLNSNIDNHPDETSIELSTESVYPGEANENCTTLDVSSTLFDVNYISSPSNKNLSCTLNLNDSADISNIQLCSSSSNFLIKENLVKISEENINETLILDLTQTEFISEINYDIQESKFEKINFIDDDSVLSQKPRDDIDVNENKKSDRFLNENFDDELLVLDDDDTEYSRYFSETVVDCSGNISQEIGKKRTSPDLKLQDVLFSNIKEIKETNLIENKEIPMLTKNDCMLKDTVKKDENNHKLSQNITSTAVEQKNNNSCKHNLGSFDFSSTIHNIDWNETIFDDIVDVKKQSKTKRTCMGSTRLTEKNKISKKSTTYPITKKVSTATAFSSSDSECSDVFDIMNDKIPQLDGAFSKVFEKELSAEAEVGTETIKIQNESQTVGKDINEIIFFKMQDLKKRVLKRHKSKGCMDSEGLSKRFQNVKLQTRPTNFFLDVLNHESLINCKRSNLIKSDSQKCFATKRALLTNHSKLQQMFYKHLKNKQLLQLQLYFLDGQTDEPCSRVKNKKKMKSKLSAGVFFEKKPLKDVTEMTDLPSFFYENKTNMSDNESKTSNNTYNWNDVEIDLNWKKSSTNETADFFLTNKDLKKHQNKIIKECSVKVVDIMKIKNNYFPINNLKDNHFKKYTKTKVSRNCDKSVGKSKNFAKLKRLGLQTPAKSVKKNSLHVSEKFQSNHKLRMVINCPNETHSKFEIPVKEPSKLEHNKSPENMMNACKIGCLRRQTDIRKNIELENNHSIFDENNILNKTKYLPKIKKSNHSSIESKENNNKLDAKQFTNNKKNEHPRKIDVSLVKQQKFESANQYDIRNNYFPQPGSSKDVSEPLKTFISDNSISSPSSIFENDYGIQSFYDTFIETKSLSGNESVITDTSNVNNISLNDTSNRNRMVYLTEFHKQNKENISEVKLNLTPDFKVKKDYSFQLKHAVVHNTEDTKEIHKHFKFLNQTSCANESEKDLHVYETVLDGADVEFTRCIEDNQLSIKNKMTTHSEENVQNFISYIILSPKYNPPSPTHIRNTLMKYDIPRIKQLLPFYTNSTDVTGSIEIGRKVLKVYSLSGKDVSSFKSCMISNGIENLRKQFIENDVTLNQVTSRELLKCLATNRSVIITPSIFPPKRKDIEFWIQKKRLKTVEKKFEKTNEKIKLRIPSSPNKEIEEDSSNECVTLSPYTPKQSSMHSDTFKNLSQYNVSSEDKNLSDETVQNSYNKIAKVSIESSDKILQTNQFSEQFITPNKYNSSCVITGPSLNGSKAFQLPLENLQDAKATIEYQFLTVFVLEVHARTRDELKPDPKIDSIQAIFYSVYNDVPANYELPRKETGIICIDVTGKNDFLHDIHINSYLNIIYVNSEIGIMSELIDLFNKWDPDILIGYEIEMLSWGYLFERASVLNVNLMSDLSRIPTGKNNNRLNENQKFSEINLVGRIILDMWRLMRHEVALYSYSFENVVYHVLHERIPKYSFRDLTFWYENNTKLYRWITVEYYVKRVEIILNLLETLDLIGRTCELARLFGIQFYEVLSRGSQFRVESMMLRLARPLNYISVSPSVQQRAKMNAPEFLPLIMEPESRFYVDPIVVLDFQSLYPSMIIAYNYCFSTCLGKVDHLGQSNPFQFGATQLKVKKSTLNNLLKKNKLHISPCGAAFVLNEIQQGILPRMLKEILDTRLMVKESMKAYKNNPTLHRILHSRQLGLKLIANVTYGYTAANFSGRMPCTEVGDSVVSKGRETLERAIKLVENNKEWKAKVVYGDTDSLFVLIPGRTRQTAFKIGAEIADAVTKDNPTPVKLKLEKVYQPCILQTKKRYVGYMYESPEQEIPEYNAKGIETVRRDGCLAVTKILEKTLRLLFETKDMSLVKQYVCKQFTKLLTGRINLQDLIFAREFRGLSGYRPGAVVPALELARRYKMQDPRNEPRRSERVPYIIVNGAPGTTLAQLSRGPHELLKDTSLRPHIMYYITRIIIPPLNRCLLLCGVDVHTWFKQLPRKSNYNLPVIGLKDIRKNTISQHFTLANCVSCGSQSKDNICIKCQENPQKTSIIISNKIQYWERNYINTKKICKMCCNCCHEIKCTSLDCPVLYRLYQTKKDFEQTPFLRDIITKLSYEDFNF